MLFLQLVLYEEQKYLLEQGLGPRYPTSLLCPQARVRLCLLGQNCLKPGAWGTGCNALQERREGWAAQPL